MSGARNGLAYLHIETANARSESERRCVDLVRRLGPKFMALAVSSPEEPEDATMEELKGPRKLKKKTPWKWKQPLRPWTDQEVRDARKMRAKKASWKHVAETLGRTPEACRMRVLAARQEEKN